MRRFRLTLAEGLGLAAAPCFALMALLTSLPASAPQPMLCGAHASVLAGMAPMYLLMSAVHLGPWLRLARRAPMP
jgi:hypothetical protein